MSPSTHLTQLLTAAEREHLLATCDRATPEGIRDYAVLALLIDCALRPGEVLQVRCAAVHEYDVTVSTKGHTRVAPLSARASQALRRYRYHARPQQGQEWEPLFLAANAMPLDLAVLVKVVHTAAEQAGCGEHLHSIHELRLAVLQDRLHRQKGS